ncbi:ImmA/IrrE family metallo-endopeptidase [Stutzerimonas xanthomarina]|uniref:ImmA/IrrE family metallo-endopeptidase n=1 Tax=Stutzerimonas xanthomarina TaxID=271420 RepID=A0A3R8W203_9GAMM|nr:ImmA/IrrE family metallo-endopeptidase [Stutzerimonas xanthomarina]RRV05099.1 ImmA/IrrE family metallo-endopeptidase [Stutzerimonas xanthomarina]
MPGVNPEVLVWARETAGLTVARAARALALGGKKLNPEQALLQYESGEKEVSRPLLSKMAATYRRPLLVFYLPAPPARADRGEDFRTVPEEIRIESKGTLDALVRDIYVRQDLIKSLLLDIDEANAKAFVGSLSLDVPTKGAAAFVGELLDLNLETFRRHRKPEEAFSYLRKCVEGLGVYVLLIGNLGSHHTDIPVEAFRGFALADSVAPVIVINDQDAPAARSFTLLHELIHILLGATGISGSRAELRIERYCNEVASETLLPTGEIESQDWPVDNLKTLLVAVSRYGARINVSGSLVAYRLFAVGLIDQVSWVKLSEELRALWLSSKAAKKEEREDGRGPSYYVVKRHKVGGALIELVNRTMREGALTATKAGRVLGVKPANVYNLVGM